MPEYAMIENHPRQSPRDFYTILFRHKWKVILFFLAVMVVVTTVILLAERIYRSEARIMVRIGRESVTLPPTATTGQVIAYGLSRESEINSELEILKSRELAQEVVDALGPQAILTRSPGDGENEKGGFTQNQIQAIRNSLRGASDTLRNFLGEIGLLRPLDRREKAVTQLMENLSIISQKDNNILLISYEARSPEQARRVLTKLIDLYFDKHITAHRTPGSYEFFDTQANQIRKQLVESEQELKNLKQQTRVASLEEQRKIAIERIGSLQQEEESTQAALAISQAKIQELKSKLAGLSERVVTHRTEAQTMPNYATEVMRGKLYELRLKEQELLSKYMDDSVQVKEIRRQIAEAQVLLDKEETTRKETTTATGINVTYQQLHQALLMEMANHASLEAKLHVIKDQLKNARKEIETLADTEMKITRLQRELALQDAKYRKYAEQLEQARIDQALEMNKISNISVIQAATFSSEPVWPRKTLTLGLGFIFGILGGMGLAFLSEFLDHSLKTPAEVEEKLKLQVLASIPDTNK